MGNFSNGSEGEGFQAKWCDHCIHDREFRQTGEGPGCAVWMLHLLYNSDASEEGMTKDGNHGPTLALMLDSLIEIDEEGYNSRCVMFQSESQEAELERAGQLTFAPQE